MQIVILLWCLVIMQYLSFVVGGKRSRHGASWEVVCPSLKITYHQLLAPKVNALLEHRSEKPEQGFTQEKVVGSIDSYWFNKRLANKFPVVCLLDGVLLHIPAMLGGFLGCSATPDPKECLLLSVTSETWRSAVPPCKHFFLSRAPAGNSLFAGFLHLFPASCGPLVASHSCLSSVAHSSFPFFSGQGLYSAPRVHHQESQQGVLSVQLLLFQIICAITTGPGNHSSEVLPHIPYNSTEK